MDNYTSLNKSLKSAKSNIISSHHKFLWDEKDETKSLENQLAKEYHDQLFKEYCISDLTHYITNQIALRWRTKQEVISGKGETICGDRKCNSVDALKSWEVNFKYVEHGKKMNTLVKLRLCKECSIKLNYTKAFKKSDKKEAGNTSKNVRMQPESCDKELSVKSSSNETIKDNEKSIWNTEDFHKIDSDINSRIDEYLQDLFLCTETNS